MSAEGTTPVDLRVVDGGAPPAFAPGGDPDVPVPARLAEDLRDPLREAERRIGFVLSGELGSIGSAHRLALGSALEALSDAGAVIELMRRAEEKAEGGKRERFDLRFAVRDGVEENRSAARAKGISLVLRLPEAPAPVRADRSGFDRFLRFALREQMRGAPPRSRLMVRVESRAGRVELTIRGGRSGRRIAPPCRSGLSLARGFLRKEGGELSISEGGGCWTASLPEPRESRRRTIPPFPPSRPSRTAHS